MRTSCFTVSKFSSPLSSTLDLTCYKQLIFLKNRGRSLCRCIWFMLAVFIGARVPQLVVLFWVFHVPCCMFVLLVWLPSLGWILLISALSWFPWYTFLEVWRGFQIKYVTIEGTCKTYIGVKLIHLFNKFNNIMQERGKRKYKLVFCGPSNKAVYLVASKY